MIINTKASMYLTFFFAAIFFSASYASSKSVSKNEQKPSSQNSSPNQKNLNAKDIQIIQKKMQNFKALELIFEQKIYRNIRKKTILNKGQAYFIKPDKFIWELTSPKKDMWIYDGKTLLSHIVGDSYALRYGPKIAKGRDLKQLVDMIMNFEALMSKYKIKEALKTQEEIKIELTPFKDNEIEKIRLLLLEKKNEIQIKELNIHFRGNNYTTFSFSGLKEAKVDVSRLTLPKNIKITDAL